jgi:hypothetical protein
MPTYDSAATYDSGLRYDQPSSPTRRPMAQIKLDFKGKTPEELVNFFTEIITAMTGNAAFPTANPTLATLSATRDALQTKINDVKAKENIWRAAIVARDTQEDTSVDLFTQLSSYVQNASGGDEVKIISSGFHVRSTATSSPVTAPQDLRATSGDNEGEIDLAWDRVRNAGSYEVQCREQGTTDWQPVKTVTKSRFTVENLTPGKTYSFRVRAIGAQGEGPWSDEAVKRAV